MTTNLQVGDKFPDFELPNHDNKLVKLSTLTQPGLMDKYLEFSDGYRIKMIQCNDVLVTLATLNLEKLVVFYSKMLGQEPTNLIPNVYAEFQVRGMKIGIFQYKASAEGEFECSVRGKMSLCLEVMDLESAIACLADLGYAPPGSMIIASHGREVYAYDPDGNRIILHQSRIED